MEAWPAVVGPDVVEVSFGARERPGFRVDPEVLTWDLGVFRVSSELLGPSFVVCVAAEDLAGWLTDLDAGRVDQTLRMQFANRPRRVLRRMPKAVRIASKSRAWRLGIEHEFIVAGAGGPVDFRTMLPSLYLDAPAADPVDPNARRVGWGVITADGPEAEIAIEAVPVAPGFARRAVVATDRARAHLESLVPADVSLAGFSTHLSVSWDPRRCDYQAKRWIRTFAVGLMLLLDGRDSPGLLVRPRPGRLEFGGEFADGAALESAALFAVGSVGALERSPARVRSLALDVTMEPAIERYGWFIARTALGPDLYVTGRATVLRRSNGLTVTAADHLNDLLPLVLDALGDARHPADTESLVAVIEGRQPLPSERTPSLSPSGIGSAR